MKYAKKAGYINKNTHIYKLLSVRIWCIIQT